jgi:Zn-dependent metalloprotease
MKQLLLSTIFLLILQWPFGSITAQHTRYQGFTELSVIDKSTTVSVVKKQLKLNNRHDLIPSEHNHKRMYHYYDEYQVVNSELVINPYGFGGSVYLFDDTHVLFDIKQEEVLELLVTQSEFRDEVIKTIRPVLYLTQSSIDPAYEIRIEDELDMSHAQLIYVSASSARILHREALTIPHNEPVIARSLYDGVVFTEVYREGEVYNMSHSALEYRTYDLAGATHTVFGQAVVGDQQILQDRLDAIQAQYALGTTLDYYALRHGRESYDDQGGPVSAYINYGDRSNNAFWFQGNLLLGGGDGIHRSDMSAVDIVGHEFTHGVIQHTADLRYSGESGALNESFADIFGEMSEFFARGKCDWQVGQQVAQSSRVRFRSFRDPKSVNHPDTYEGQNWINQECGLPVGFNDFCGVHTNSSVQNKWFYILANGEAGVNDRGDQYQVTGITPNAAAAIAYKNLTEYLWSTSTFRDAREGAILAAKELYGEGSLQEISTTNAWYAVGVGEPYETRLNLPEQVDTFSYLNVSINNLKERSMDVSWSRVDTLWDTLIYEVLLDGSVVVSTSDSTAQLVDLLPNSQYELSIKGYRDSILVALSDTIPVFTPDEEIRTGQLAAFYFEEGLDGWSVSSDDAAWYQGSNSPEGRGSIRLRDDYDQNMILSPWINTSSVSSIDVSLSLYAWSVEFGEDLTIEYRGDSIWHTAVMYRSIFDFSNDQVTSFAFGLEGLDYREIQFRVSLDASANTDHVYLDEFVVNTGLINTSFAPVASDIEIWPNPVVELVNVNVGSTSSKLQIFDLSGQLVYDRTQQSGLVSINMSHLQSGLYHIEISSDDHSATYPIVKE